MDVNSRNGRGRTTLRAPRRDKRAELAVVLLLASPAVIIPDGLDRFVFGKLAVAAVGVAVAMATRPTGSLDRAVRLILVAAGAILLAAALASHSPWAALAGRSDRYEGVLVLTTYVLSGISGARLLGPRRARGTEQAAMITLAAVSGLVAVFAVLESAGLRPLSSNLYRPGGLLGNADDEGILAAMYALVMLRRAVTDRVWWVITGLAAAAATVVLSASRAALLGLLVGALLLAVLSTRRTRLPIAGAVAAVVVAAFAVPFTRHRILGQTPFSGRAVSGRSLLWQESLALIGRHPMLGVGPSNFEAAITVEHDRQWQTQVGPANAPESAHDWVLQVLSAGGVLLLLAVLMLLVLVGRQVWPAIRARDPWMCGLSVALIGYGVALLATPTAPSTMIPAAVLGGSLVAVSPKTVGQGPVRPLARRTSLATSGLAALLAAAFALASIAEAQLRSATVDVAHGRLAAAQQLFRDAHDLRPWDVDLPATALHEFAVVAEVGHRDAIAPAVYWAARVGPVDDDEQVVLDRASVLEALGRYSAAVRLLESELRRDRDDPLVLLRLGVLHGELRQWARAEHDLLASASITPTSPQPWLDLVIVYRATDQPAKARFAQRRATRLSR